MPPPTPQAIFSTPNDTLPIDKSSAACYVSGAGRYRQLNSITGMTQAIMYGQPASIATETTMAAAVFGAFTFTGFRFTFRGHAPVGGS